MSIPFPSARRTSAKGPADKPRRVRLVCPVDDVRFSLNRAEYRRALKRGFRPTCCPKCGAKYRKIREAEKRMCVA